MRQRTLSFQGTLCISQRVMAPFVSQYQIASTERGRKLQKQIVNYRNYKGCIMHLNALQLGGIIK